MRGRIALQRRDYVEAERLFQESLVKSRASGNDREIAISLEDLGFLAIRRQAYEIAKQYYLEALTLAKQANDVEVDAFINGDLGSLALRCEQWDEAHKWFEQELPMAKEVGRQDLIAQAQYGLSRVHEAEGRADLALPLAQSALKIYERLQHKSLAGVRELVQRIQSGKADKSAR